MTRKLHIGGQVSADGWEVLDANPGPHVHHVGNAADLSRFSNETFSEIYASHVAEHLDYRGDLQHALREWYRALRPGGRLYISVPDIDVLAELFLQKDRLSPDERFHVMRMIFGGHTDQFDYHLVGLNREFLTIFLLDAGYVKVQAVQEFGLFRDTSTLIFKGVRISLNLIAEKPSA